ncbi:H-NS family nucleoid-associated regulatory protein [Vibrio owensii]|uniref:H-NS family histone-like protein n=1 Tax=Vibrio owensii TaxID=696485 RepID=UPI0018F22A28|nr:H-NS family nucleoid-associated regulatory protein [Vibrio owensii]
MSVEIAKTLLNVKSLKIATNILSTKELEDGLAKLSKVVSERRDQERELAERQALKMESIESILNSMHEMGVTIEDLQASLQKDSSSKRNKRPAKYRYISEQGDEKGWTGQGRTPSVIQRAIEAGGSLEDFLI